MLSVTQGNTDFLLCEEREQWVPVEERKHLFSVEKRLVEEERRLYCISI